jgi:hypothetical protein
MNPGQNSSEPKPNFIEAEMQHNIPVKPHAAEPPRNPITSAQHILDHGKKNDKDLDRVLDDVNKSIKEPNKKSNRKILSIFQKKVKEHKAEESPKQHKEPQAAKTSSTKPVGVFAAAALVSCGLIFAAYYAFNHAPTSVSKEKPNSSKTSAATAANTPTAVMPEITSADLTKLTSDLTTQINALSDAQDFNPTDLSDSNLGL